MNNSDIIQGDKFRSLAKGNIYYCKTENVNNFFQTKTFDKPFVLISHNSDGKIVSGTCGFPNASIDLIPSTLIKWFAQNVNIEDDRIIAIPIGLENNYIPNATLKHEKLMQMLSYPKIEKNLAYMNFNVETNPSERIPVWNKFINSSFVTAESQVGIDKFLKGLISHTFVFCPEGNGTDTHRTWETLYAGGIPIEKRNKNNKHFFDLPICFVDNWDQVTEDFLISEKQRIMSKNWNFKKLNFSYWESIINTYE